MWECERLTDPILESQGSNLGTLEPWNLGTLEPWNHYWFEPPNLPTNNLQETHCKREMGPTDGPGPFFYKNASDENAIKYMRCLFENLDSTHSVYALYELNEEGMIALHNHMNSATIWDPVPKWDSGIRYTINHPDGEIKISDTNRGETTEIYRESVLNEFKGQTSGGDVAFSVFRTTREPVDFSVTSCHASRYTWVEIESRKTFKYTSERASWDFNLSVAWEGRTKEAAEASKKRYLVNVSMASIDRASRDPGYTTASFIEKLMDTLFQKSSSRHIVLF